VEGIKRFEQDRFHKRKKKQKQKGGMAELTLVFELGGRGWTPPFACSSNGQKFHSVSMLTNSTQKPKEKQDQAWKEVCLQDKPRHSLILRV
jgi:hypothetical protein